MKQQQIQQLLSFFISPTRLDYCSKKYPKNYNAVKEAFQIT
ncbi:hypothetical protein ACT7DO_16085 [Bacillus pacificus]